MKTFLSVLAFIVTFFLNFYIVKTSLKLIFDFDLTEFPSMVIMYVLFGICTSIAISIEVYDKLEKSEKEGNFEQF
jgi:hypothetical protein